MLIPAMICSDSLLVMYLHCSGVLQVHWHWHGTLKNIVILGVLTAAHFNSQPEAFIRDSDVVQ